jgi:putative SOS response-associated peptidase YedK
MIMCQCHDDKDAMCGRFVIAFTDGFHNRFQVPMDEVEVKPRYNIAPSQMVPVVLRKSPNHLEQMRWGLIPSWAKEEKSGLKLINARCETVREKPAFKRLVAKQRCLVPATGFYEWMKTDEGKVPYYVHRQDNRYMSFAGIYDRWRSPTGETISSFTIITTHANDMMLPLHDRMPVILKEDEEEIWLEKGEIEDHELKRLFTPIPSDDLEAYEVPRLVRNPGLETPDLIQKVTTKAKTVQMHF